MKKTLLLLAAILCLSIYSWAQTTGAAPRKAKAVLAEGTVVAGYVDKGAFINFTGPSLKWSHKPTWSLAIGVLPSLKIKEDKSVAPAKKNSAFTPSLGFGFTYTYKHLALQVPLYYSAKTASADGKWNIGIGAGYKF